VSGPIRRSATPRSRARPRRIGPDTPDLTHTVLLRELGAMTEEQIAATVLTQARLPGPTPEIACD
jgi:hypothetical protein